MDYPIIDPRKRKTAYFYFLSWIENSFILHLNNLFEYLVEE
jgi:hypothetical protein